MKHKRLIIATTILVFAMVCALSLKELFGCLLVFIAVILAQIELPIPKKKKEQKGS